jgi:hypothetical protein
VERAVRAVPLHPLRRVLGLEVGSDLVTPVARRGGAAQLDRPAEPRGEIVVRRGDRAVGQLDRNAGVTVESGAGEQQPRLAAPGEGKAGGEVDHRPLAIADDAEVVDADLVELLALHRLDGVAPQAQHSHRPMLSDDGRAEFDTLWSFRSASRRR